MSFRQGVVLLLLSLGVGAAWIGSLGVFTAGRALDQLHYVGLTSLWSPAAIAVAIVLEEGISKAGTKALTIAAVLLVLNPILTHATGRATYRIEERRRTSGSSSKDAGENR